MPLPNDFAPCKRNSSSQKVSYDEILPCVAEGSWFMGSLDISCKRNASAIGAIVSGQWFRPIGLCGPFDASALRVSPIQAPLCSKLQTQRSFSTKTWSQLKSIKSHAVHEDTEFHNLYCIVFYDLSWCFMMFYEILSSHCQWTNFKGFQLLWPCFCPLPTMHMSSAGFLEAMLNIPYHFWLGQLQAFHFGQRISAYLGKPFVWSREYLLKIEAWKIETWKICCLSAPLQSNR